MVAVDFRNADVTRFVASFFIAAAAATSNNISRFETRINRKSFLSICTHSASTNAVAQGVVVAYSPLQRLGLSCRGSIPEGGWNPLRSAAVRRVPCHRVSRRAQNKNPA